MDESPPPRLSESQLAAALTCLPDWTVVDEGIEKSVAFRNFSEAFAFMTRVALLAECHNHHPDWSNAWNRVHLRLSTHESGGLTQRDIELAAAIEEVLQS